MTDANLLRKGFRAGGTLAHQLSLETRVPDDPSTRGHDGQPARAPRAARRAGADDAPVEHRSVVRVSSLRDLQRARLEAEAQRLTRLEAQLANLQLILKTDQARLAIDRLRFAVHGLCGTIPGPADRSAPAELPPQRRLVRVK